MMRESIAVQAFIAPASLGTRRHSNLRVCSVIRWSLASTARDVITAVRIPSATVPVTPDALLAAGSVLSAIEPHDLSLTGGILVTVVAWLGLWQRLTALTVVPSKVTRKAIHISCGPAFVFLWPFFTDAPSARFLAATVPLLFVVVLVISGSARDSSGNRGALGRALSREGQAREVLQGPLYYSVVLLVTALLLFKGTAAVVAIIQLCFGDGAAEVFGRKFGKRTQWGLSWTGDKSIAGTLAFAVSAFLGSCGGVAWFHYQGVTQISLNDPYTLFSLATISVACAALELVPKQVIGDDNLTIAILSIVLSLGLFGSKALY